MDKKNIKINRRLIKLGEIDSYYDDLVKPDNNSNYGISAMLSSNLGYIEKISHTDEKVSNLHLS
jgi:hypothetical protein